MLKVLAVIGALLLFAGHFATPAAAQTPPSVAVRYTSTFTNVHPPARHFNLLHGVSEFSPGEAARPSYSPGPRFFTLLEGEVTVLIGDKTQVFKAGQTWDAPGGIYHGVTNEGSVRARIFFSVLNPIGGMGGIMPGSTPPASPSRILHTTQTPVTVSTNTITVIQMVQDWPAGARNSNHMMNQPHLYSMMEGENTTRFFDGRNERFTANQAGVMAVGQGGYMENSGATSNRLFFTWAATPGQPNTLPATPPVAGVAAPPPVAGAPAPA